MFLQMKSSQVLIVFIMVFPFSEGLTKLSVYSFKGRRSIPHSQPWLLNLKLKTTNKSFCAANLIAVPYLENSSDIAITACHCAHMPLLTRNSYVAIASDHDQRKVDRGEVEVEIGIDDSVCHSNYTSYDLNDMDDFLHVHYDIAILKLSKPLNFSETIRPIELPRMGEEIPTDAECHVAGWGATEYGLDEDGRIVPMKQARFLRQFKVIPSNRSKCSSINKEFDTETELCSISAYNCCHPAEGDSGAAMVCKRNARESVLYGVVSYGGSSERIHEGYYARVSAFIDWIREEIDYFHNEGTSLQF